VDPDPEAETQELRVEQILREREERTAEHEAVQPDEAELHARRAERAGYLEEKLAERAASERDATE